MSGASLCGSRRLVYVNMVVSSEEDRMLIKNLYELKGYGVQRLIKEFPTKGWKLRALNKLLSKLKDPGTTDRRPGSGRPRSARTASNINTVNDLVLRVRKICHEVTALLVKSAEKRASLRLL